MSNKDKYKCHSCGTIFEYDDMEDGPLSGGIGGLPSSDCRPCPKCDGRGNPYTKEMPKLDYWMIGILEECAKTEIKRLSSRWSAGYVEKQLEGRNEYDNFGQIQLILDRLNEMQTHYDNEIKDGLKKQ